MFQLLFCKVFGQVTQNQIPDESIILMAMTYAIKAYKVRKRCNYVQLPFAGSAFSSQDFALFITDE